MTIYGSTQKYLKKRANENGLVVPDNYECFLSQYCKITADFGYKLEFRKGRGLSENKIGANSGLLKKKQYSGNS